MRGVFGVVGLLLVLVAVGWLAKSQLQMVGGGKEARPSAGSVPGVPAPIGAQDVPNGNVQQHSQQVQQQFKAMADAAIQTPRAMPEDN